MADRAGRRAWLGLAVLALPALLLSLDISVLFLALPELSADLGADRTEQLWITDIYGFMVAGLLVTMGTLGDRIGRRRLLLAGAAAFAAASVLAAYASSPEMLIAARALLGVAGATLGPSTLALISSLFADPAQRGQAIALWFSCFLAGGALGPLVGGVLLELFWWGSVFLVGVPVMALLLVLGPRLLPEDRAPDAGRLDPASVALALAAMLPVVYGLKALAREGWSAPALAALAAGVACGAAFVWRQRRLADPLLDLRLFRIRALSAALGVSVLGGVVLGGIFLAVSQYLQLVAGRSPLEAGLWLLPGTLAMIAGTLAGPRLARRLGPARVVAAGMLTAAAGALVLTQVGSDGAVGVLVAGFSLFFLGNGLPGGIGIGLIVGAAPPERAGSASALSETGQELGLSLGLATLGSLALAVSRSELGGQPAPPSGERLTGVAADAFTAGLTTTAAVGTACLVALAAVAAVALRGVEP
jgi:DHA2 family multidrug resistance protein-like MFS transporter